MQFRRSCSLRECAGASRLIIAAALLANRLPAQATRLPDEDLVSLWGAEPQLGPQVRGALLLARSGQAWTLRIAGFEARATQVGDSAALALPGGQGTLRLWLRANRPEAWWVQPAGLGSSFAVPLRLAAAGPDHWRGTVTPVTEEFPLYLAINRAPDGQLRGVFRNPSQNWPGRVPYFVVARSGDAVTFTNPRTGRVQFRQPYDSAQRTITFDFGVPVVLTPRTLEQAVGLTPRSPSLPPYTYRRPTAHDDGWTVNTAAAVGLAAPALTALVQGLVSTDPLSDSAPRLHALLVARHGQLVLEEYFRGYSASTVHDLRSASKTMTSIMVGAAKQRGAALSSRTTLPGSRITLGHLLSHSSGKACDDDDSASPGNEDTMQSQRTQRDWYAFFDALPQVTEPGQRYAYCSAGINRVGQLLGSASGRWLPRLFDEALARPMQFGSYGINLMPSGNAYSGGGMHLLPRDFLKFGPLMLSGGLWRGARLVNAAWVRESMAHRIDRADGSADGLGWHRHVLSVRGRSYQTVEASGNGGQFLLLVPELDLAIVATAGNYGQFDVWRTIRDVLALQIIEATCSATSCAK